jgi:hypothetical protein
MRTQADGITDAQASAATHRESLVYSMLKHPLRHKILIRTGERPWSPKEIADDTGEELKRVCEQVNVLLRQSPPFLELVDERPGPRGGPPRHLYRAMVRVNVTVAEWERLTPHEQGQQTVTITEELHKEWIDSIESGVFYTDPHHCLMRTAMTVDLEGMQRVEQVMLEAQAQFADIEREAAERRAQSGTDAVRLITGFASFRAAPE